MRFVVLVVPLGCAWGTFLFVTFSINFRITSINQHIKTMEKTIYEAVKSIKHRIVTGQTTTFAERNYMTIVLKQEAKKRKLKNK